MSLSIRTGRSLIGHLCSQHGYYECYVCLVEWELAETPHRRCCAVTLHQHLGGAGNGSAVLQQRLWLERQEVPDAVVVECTGTNALQFDGHGCFQFHQTVNGHSLIVSGENGAQSSADGPPPIRRSNPYAGRLARWLSPWSVSASERVRASENLWVTRQCK